MQQNIVAEDLLPEEDIYPECQNDTFAVFNFEESCMHLCLLKQVSTDIQGKVSCDSGEVCLEDMSTLVTVQQHPLEETTEFSIFVTLNPAYEQFPADVPSAKFMDLPFGYLHVEPSDESVVGQVVYHLDETKVPIGPLSPDWNKLWVTFDSETRHLKTFLNEEGMEETVTNDDLTAESNAVQLFGDLPFCYKHLVAYDTVVSLDSIEDIDDSTKLPEPQP